MFCCLLLGWDEGCLSMRQGERSKLHIRWDKAYGAGGFPAWGYPFYNCFINVTKVYFLFVRYLVQQPGIQERTKFSQGVCQKTTQQTSALFSLRPRHLSGTSCPITLSQFPSLISVWIYFGSISILVGQKAPNNIVSYFTLR